MWETTITIYYYYQLTYYNINFQVSLKYDKYNGYST